GLEGVEHHASLGDPGGGDQEHEDATLAPEGLLLMGEIGAHLVKGDEVADLGLHDEAWAAVGIETLEVEPPPALDAPLPLERPHHAQVHAGRVADEVEEGHP